MITEMLVFSRTTVPAMVSCDSTRSAVILGEYSAPELVSSRWDSSAHPWASSRDAVIKSGTRVMPSGSA